MDKTLFSYARQFFSGTLLSRTSGFFRDVSMAYAFGDIPEIAALILAYRLCMLLRRVLGEGSMQSAFIPGYQTIRENDPTLAFSFFNQILWKWLLFVSALASVLGVILHLSCPYFSPSWQMVIELCIKLLPCLVFVIGYTLFQALLQCHGRYFTASWAPIFSNLLWGVGCLFAAKYDPKMAMNYVSYFICLGLFLQWIILWPEVRKIVPQTKWRLQKNKISSDLYGFNFLSAVALSAIGVSATQINSALDGVFAKFADPKGPIHLWFSIRIQQLPLALLSIGLVSAASPKICKLLASGLKEEAKQLLFSVESKISSLMIFLTSAIIAVGAPVIALLFEHGMFSHDASHHTLYCLIAYMIGLLPTSLATSYASFFYALKDYKTPSKASIYCLIANLILNSLFIFGFKMGSWSVAGATSLCSFLNAYLLKKELKAKNLAIKPDLKTAITRYLVALLALLASLPIQYITSSLAPLLSVAIVSLSFLVLYAAFSYLMKFHEAKDLVMSFVSKKAAKEVRHES